MMQVGAGPPFAGGLHRQGRRRVRPAFARPCTRDQGHRHRSPGSSADPADGLEQAL